MKQPGSPQVSGFSAVLTITNQVDELARVAFWFNQAASYFQLSERAVFKLDVVLSEALPNIIKYAYQDQLRHDIVIGLEDKNDRVVLEIIDDGVAFNPFAENTYTEALSLESASIGGRGIHLISAFSDVQEYQRVNQTNVMRVSILKPIEAGKDSVGGLD